ncbi:MAG: hypothetical protein EAZ55_13215 [Cytophagales bacterium]|nr:MAG: hypothetical protein EAZ55_13215 [Cytophagales bacterium]
MKQNYPNALIQVNKIILFLNSIIIYESSNILIMETSNSWEFHVKHHLWEFLFLRMIINSIVITVLSLFTFLINHLIIEMFEIEVKKTIRYAFVFPFLLMQALSILFLIISVSFPRSLFYFIDNFIQHVSSIFKPLFYFY